MKNKNRKSKGLLIVALILLISVGYAALATTLNITGNSEIKTAKWDIHFDNLVVDSNSVEATRPAAIDESKLTVNYGVHLVKPGDVYSFTVDVVNEGTIDGMINVVSNTGLTEEQQKYVEYSIAYDNGTPLQANDGLKAGAKRNIKVIVKYKADLNPEDLPSEEDTIELTLKVTYVQADDTAQFPAVPMMKSYSSSPSDDYHNSKYKSKVTKIVTKTDIDVPDSAIEQWDVSEAGNNSIIAYIEDDGSGNGTYKVTIGANGTKFSPAKNSSSLFSYFTGLKEVDLSNFDTSNVVVMTGMFGGCSSLLSADLSSFDTSNVTDMGNMFYGCSSLTSVNLSSFDTSKVTYMWYMFNDCSKLVNLDLSSFNTKSATTMQSMFSWCTSLTSLNLSSFKTGNVTSMEYMFSNCSNLVSLDLSNFDISKVTTMSSMFNGCGKLKSLDLSSFAESNVTNMSYMFQNCSSLTSLDVSNLDTSKVTNMENMFWSCSSLESLDLSSFNLSKITSLNNIFYNCSSLTSIDLSSFDTTGNVTDMNYMFYNCSSLTSLDLSHFNTSKVTNMNSMFSGCSSLTSLNLSHLDANKVTNMSSMFYNCSGLTGINFNNFDTSNVTDMSYMFYNCGSLTNVDLSGFDTSHVTDMSAMFFQCSKIVTVIPILNSSTSRYEGMSNGAATEDGAQITLNYTSATSDLVDRLVNGKGMYSNVVKGSLIS